MTRIFQVNKTSFYNGDMDIKFSGKLQEKIDEIVNSYKFEVADERNRLALEFDLNQCISDYFYENTD